MSHYVSAHLRRYVLAYQLVEACRLRRAVRHYIGQKNKDTNKNSGESYEMLLERENYSSQNTGMETTFKLDDNNLHLKLFPNSECEKI